MRIAVIDCNYAQDRFAGMSATWLRWEMQVAGVAEVPAPDADVILATVSSQQGIHGLRGALRRAGNRKARVIVGGGGAYAPAVFDGLADAACVGEGARFVRTLFHAGYDAALSLPESWIPGETRPVIPNEDFPWELPPLNHPDGTARVFGSRGCRYRCLFCQTGWERGYQTNPDPERLQAQIQRVERFGKRVAVVTNDGAEAGVHISGQQEFLSVRFDNLLRLMPLSRHQVKSVRVGVEGISERLRAAVGKPVPTERLIRVTYDLLTAGIVVRWFFVPGLPGESDADYAELRSAVSELRHLPKGAVMMNFHAFIPQPATPLGIFGLSDEYWERFDGFREWFFDGPGFTRRVQIVPPARYAGRLARAMESMAGDEAELRRGWWQVPNRNWRVRYRSSVAEIRRVASVYARRLGMAEAGCLSGVSDGAA